MQWVNALKVYFESLIPFGRGYHPFPCCMFGNMRHQKKLIAAFTPLL